MSAPANPTGTGSTTGVMMGLAGSITPSTTGKVLLIVSGSGSNNTASRGWHVDVRYGTGTAPGNNDALTGTIAGPGFGPFADVLAANATIPFSRSVLVTGLTVSTAYWIDVSLNARTAGIAALFGLEISAIEL